MSWRQAVGPTLIAAASIMSFAVIVVGAVLPAWREPGFVEGQNVVIEYRSAEEHLDRLPALVADLMRRPAEVIVGNTPFGTRNDDGAKATADRARSITPGAFPRPAAFRA